MVKHIILWTLKDSCDKEKVKREMKTALEALVGVVPGLLTMKIETDPLPTSNAEVMLYSELESAEALRGYATHPAHVAVAEGKVRPFTQTRTVMDFEAEA